MLSAAPPDGLSKTVLQIETAKVGKVRKAGNRDLETLRSNPEIKVHSVTALSAKRRLAVPA